MNTKSRLSLLAAALAASHAAWAATDNVDVYGQITMPVAPLPTHQIYSAAATVGSNFFGSTFIPQIEVTNVVNATAQISGIDHIATARTTQGDNHAYASFTNGPSDLLATSAFSGWYDQVTISGGTGSGTLQFSVSLTGNVTAGAHVGIAGYGLLASSIHPTQLASNLLTFNVLNSTPWALDSDQVTEIALYTLAASPYNDPNKLSGLFTPAPSPIVPGGGIPAIPNPDLQLGGETGMGFPEFVPDLILTPGANQPVNVTLTGTLEFTYGQTFYLIGALNTTVLGGGLAAFTPFEISDSPESTLAVDGTGPTTLDFANSAHLVGIVLPEGASFASASGTAYNVTAVPEPSEWLLMLAGLGLIGWRMHRRA